MVTIEYNKRTINVPQSWEDVTLGLYEEVYFLKPETHRGRVALVAKICQVEADLLFNWPAEIFNIIVAHIDFIFGDNPTPASPIVEINGVTHCVAIDDVLTLGEWIDAEDVQKKAENIISGVLCIVCRPTGEKYDPVVSDARRAEFAALPMSKVLGVMAFFLQCKHVLEQHTAASMKLQAAVAQLPRFTNLFLRRGAGIKWWRILPAVRYLVLTMLLRYQLRRYLRSYSTKKIETRRKTRKTN